MTMNDDELFLIQHLRNCFITNDDSGLCETLIEPDLLRDFPGKASLGEERLNHRPKSPDILPDVEYGDRLRSGTRLRIEKIKKEKSERSREKTVRWRVGDNNYLDEESLAELFPVREMKLKTNYTSALTRLLKAAQEDDTRNPFSEYKQFDGEHHVGSVTKKIDVFLTMQNAEDRSNPLPLVIATGATVQQTIGLACCKYTEQQLEPPLPSDIRLFSLHMVEDDGDIDEDFPALNNQEPISKFGFSKLALVADMTVPSHKCDTAMAHDADPASQSNSIGPLITVHIPSSGTTKFRVSNDSIRMGEILTMVLERRKMRTRGRLMYRLEHESRPGKAIDPNTQLNSHDTREFYLVREHSSRGTSLDEVSPSASTVSATSQISYSTLQSFTAIMVTKVLSNLQVQIHITAEKLNIQPVSMKSSLRNVFGQKPTSVDVDSILRCEITKSKPGKNSAFVVNYLTSDNNLRRYTFEAPDHITNAAVEAINAVVDKRDEYTGKLDSTDAEKKRRQSSLY